MKIEGKGDFSCHKTLVLSSDHKVFQMLFYSHWDYTVKIISLNFEIWFLPIKGGFALGFTRWSANFSKIGNKLGI